MVAMDVNCRADQRECRGATEGRCVWSTGKKRNVTGRMSAPLMTVETGEKQQLLQKGGGCLVSGHAG